MLLQYKYSKKEIEQLLKDIIILVDSGEKKNQHILNILKSKKLDYETVKLDYGDYSFKLKSSELTFGREIDFRSRIVIERKNSLEELSTNFGKKRIQFENELLRKQNCHLILMVEDSSLDMIIDKKYNTGFNPRAFLATLFSFQFRYNMQVSFIPKFHSANFIWSTFYYYLREELKR
jgi:ERCC4-type nuclease